MKKIILPLIALTISFLSSCQKEASEFKLYHIENAKSTFLKNNHNGLRRVDLSDYSISPITKKTDGYSNIIYDDNLKWNLAKHLQRNSIAFTQVPIDLDGTYSRAEIIDSFSIPTSIGSLIKLSTVNQYLIIRENKRSKTYDFFVVTMIWFTQFNRDIETRTDYLDITEFNGLVLYSDLNGDILHSILCKNGKYSEAKLLTSSSFTKSEDFYVKLYAPIKSKSIDCEICGYGLAVQDLYTGLCPLCGSWYRVLDDVIISSTGNYIGLWDNIWEEQIYIPPTPSESEGEGGGYGAINKTYSYPNSSWNLDKTSNERLRPTLDLISNTTYGSKLLAALKPSNIKFRYDPSLLAFSVFRSSTNTIFWNCDGNIPQLKLIHELVHALQNKNGSISSSCYLNNEIEAFMAEYKYAVEYNLTTSLYGNYNDWENAFNPYISSPTSHNYELISNFVTYLGAPYNTYADNPDHRNFNNIDSIFTK